MKRVTEFENRVEQHLFEQGYPVGEFTDEQITKINEKFLLEYENALDAAGDRFFEYHGEELAAFVEELL